MESFDRYCVWPEDGTTQLSADEVLQMEAYRRAWETGDVQSLITALEWCNRRQGGFLETLQYVPQWAMVGAIELLRKTFDAEARRVRETQSTSNPVSPLRPDRTDL